MFKVTQVHKGNWLRPLAPHVFNGSNSFVANFGEGHQVFIPVKFDEIGPVV